MIPPRALAPLLLAACALAAAQPRIASPSPVHHFGARLISSAIDHQFIIQNHGDAPLELLNFKYTCGCTIASMDEKVIQPGGQTIVHAHLNFMGAGPVRKELLLLSNDPLQPQFPLVFEGEALPIIKITPDHAQLGDVLDDARFELPITLQAGADSVSFNISGNILSTVDWLDFNIEELTPGKSYRVLPRVIRRPSPGITNLRISIPTDHPDLPQVHTIVSANIVGDYLVWPGALRFLVSENAPPRTLEFSVSEGRLGKFSILEAIPPRDGIKITVTPAGEHSQYHVLVENFPVNDTSLSGKEILLKTNLESPVRIPLEAIQN